MSEATTNHGLPYPTGGDPVVVHGDLRALAVKTDSELGTLDAAVVEAADLAGDAAARALVVVDAPEGLGPIAVGTDGQAMPLDPMSVRPLTLLDVDAPGPGLWVVGPDGQAVNLVGGTEPDTDGLTVDQTTRAALDAKARRITSAPRRTTRAVVAIVADDYPADTIDLLAPLMAARSLPWSWCVCGGMFDPGFLYASFTGGKTWADVAALDPAQVELVNHGWSHQDVTDPALLRHEVVESRERIIDETGRDILGWMPAGVDYPEGLRWKTAPLLRTSGAEELYHRTTGGRLILGSHAWATDTLQRPGDGGLITHPLDGSPRMLAARQWLDYAADAGVEVDGIGDEHVAAAVERGHGVILSLHATHIQGGMAGTNRMTLAGLTGFLDRLEALRDAGEVDVVQMTQWHYSQIGA